MIVSGRVRYHDALRPLMRDISTIQPHPENYNNGDLEEIGASIDENGMCEVIKVQASTGYIISGNHTYFTLLERDATEAPCIDLHVSDTRAKKLMIALNAIPRLAKPDNSQLLSLVQEIATEDSLRGIGISERQVEVLEHLAEMEPIYPALGWPTLTFQVHPNQVHVFREMTREAETDADKFELLLRLAGWDGR